MAEWRRELAEWLNENVKVDWLQTPVTKFFFLIILFDNPLK